MLISDSHQFVFVHVRRAAGTTLRRHLAPYALPRRRGLAERALSRLGCLPDYRRHAFRAHAPLAAARRAMPRDRYERYFKFAFVRNPWARLASEYEYIRSLPSHSRHRRVRAMSFAAYVRFQAGRRDGDEVAMLLGPDGRIGLDFVGRVEHLQEEFDRVCRRLALPVMTLPKLNGSLVRDYRSYYDEETARFVGETWAHTIQAFGYRFDQPLPD